MYVSSITNAPDECFLLLSLAAMLQGVQRWLLGPLLALRDWASSIRQGDFSSRLPRLDNSEIGELVDDINRLSEWLEALAEERERELQAQQERQALQDLQAQMD